MVGLLASILAFLSQVAFASESSLSAAERKVIEENIPRQFLSMRAHSSGKKLTLENGIGYQVQASELAGKGKGIYFVVLYQAFQSAADRSCELMAMRSDGSVVSEKTQSRFDSQMGNCHEWELKDLDGDGIDEVILKTANLRLQENPPDIFRWNGRGFVDITPVDSDKNTMLGKFLVTEARVGRSLLMVAYSGDLSADRFDRLYVLKDGKFSQIGIYDWYLFRKKEAAAPKVFSDVFSLAAGDYTINVESRSADPTKAVRVEFKVGDNVIVKASDMCSGPAPKGYKPPNAGDGNEDKNKGCIARKSTYTVVKLTGKEAFKMTVYGATGSMVDVSLKKK